MKLQEIELLSPAGSFPSLIAAVKGGCDAVYFGLKEFNMRDNARNFSIRDLSKIDRICRESGRKIKKYLTLNTIIFDSETGRIEEILKQVKNKVDAVICWDMSVIQLCRKNKIPFHISTQASVANSKAAKFYKKLGAERIILARELNLKQVAKIAKIIPVEVFIHGAMCVSISGRCFTSGFLYGKSANRGKCMQACRKSYIVMDDSGKELKLENNRVMSAKDLCCLPLIEKLKNAGVKAFKIEGRNRDAEYVYNVTRVYRQALDRKLSKKEIEKLTEELKKVYNRGFSSGFYLGVPGIDDFSKSHSGSAEKRKKFIGKVLHYWKKIGVARIKLNAGKLKVGDEILVSGKNTFFQTKIESMEINHKKVEEVVKGQEVALKVEKCRKGDDVYVFE